MTSSPLKPSLLKHLPVSNPQLSLRAMKQADAPAYAADTMDADVKQFGHLPLEHYTPEIVSEMIDGSIADGLRSGELAVLTIAVTASDRFAGSLVLFDFTDHDAEIGYWVAPDYRGQNIAYKALMLAADYARTLGLRQLRARTVTDNSASVHVLHKAGFVKTGLPEAETTPSGKTALILEFTLQL
ncbi:RimJ/RimL family protein N-acetyltransferase [Paenochrobactrum gallinarii]|uniref:RimJ/RimL family protein N-acetyltransferase n=1 Tax=Paenochrobactrum gallinarii TaxID=643673 RepID=A0A841M624_9HYPH|nr:GNAT family protein [Paenochrobactrum gallinarii]MBB6261024.1 RimJ/RimL family protein N-acetyltransferase [Paenochrobactrum gallinarii]